MTEIYLGVERRKEREKRIFFKTHRQYSHVGTNSRNLTMSVLSTFSRDINLELEKNVARLR